MNEQTSNLSKENREFILKLCGNIAELEKMIQIFLTNTKHLKALAEQEQISEGLRGSSEELERSKLVSRLLEYFEGNGRLGHAQVIRELE